MTLLLVLLQVLLAVAVLSVAAALVVAAVLAVNGRMDAREVLAIALGDDPDSSARVLTGEARAALADADSGVLGVRARLQRPGG